MASFIGSILYLFTLLLLSIVRGEDFPLMELPTQDNCANICIENSHLLPKLDLINYDQVVCQRGCRFFNIDSFKDALDLNVTKKECYLSCEESYIVKKETRICKIGCDLMMKKRENEMGALLIFVQPDNPNIMLIESDLEMLENDLMSDPSIRSQIQIGLNIAYKIPETHIRTMPLKNTDADISTAFIIKTTHHQNGGDWLDCASRNSGIPRWVLLIAILSAVLVALWLSFSTEKKSECSDTSGPTRGEYEPMKIPPVEEREVQFSSPPKYSLESDKV